MKINFDSIKPIYVQIAEGIEDDIITGALNEGDPCYSQLVIAKELNVNPATAAKGINLLVAEDILHKQRGLAMIVQDGARERIIEKRKREGFQIMVGELVNEAMKLGLIRKDVLLAISNYYTELEGKDHV